MEIYQLEAFNTVCSTLNFSKAAEILHVTQPAISQAIKTIENELGVSLFVRSKAGLEITDIGRLIQLPVEEILNNIHNISDVIDEYKMSKKELIRLGMPMIACSNIIAPLIYELSQQLPQTDLVIIQGDTFAMSKQLKTNELDMLCIPTKFVDEKMESILLCDTQSYVFFKKGYKLSSYCKVPPSALIDEKLLIGPKFSHFNQLVLEYLYENNVDFNVDWISSMPMHPTFYMDRVSKGTGITILDSSMLIDGDIDCRPLDPPVHIKMSLAWMKSRHLTKSHLKLINFMADFYHEAKQKQ